MNAFARLNRQDGLLLLIGAIISLGAVASALVEALPLVVTMICALLLLVLGVLIQIRRRATDIRERLGVGIVQIRRDVDQGTGRSRSWGSANQDASYRRLLAAVETE